MAVRDYYQVLGVERGATDREIKHAYRKLAMEYHPDRNQNKPGCEEQLKEINEAYQVLGDDSKRQLYDLTTRSSFYGHPNHREVLSDDLIEILRVFSRGGFGMKGFGRCRGMGFGRKSCGRWKETY
ncbi:MAG: J domain-containing protein [Deltaproteobacteria bacterium]|nr:J domain-containing protein [Deltaproteobacteria bacterium]